jgi:hypothetical protein
MERDQQPSKWLSAVSLSIAMVAAVAAFLPFAVDTSAWNAVTLRVPGDQGNWWHFLAGAPFFLAFAMIWLSLRSMLSFTPSRTERRILWGMVAFSVCGTLLVEMPVLLRLGNLAQMGLRRQLTLLVPGLGILALCLRILVSRRRWIPSSSGILLGLCAAYLTNATFCLGMYAPYRPQSGWYITMAIIWLTALQVLWIAFDSYRTSQTGLTGHAADTE